MWNAKQILIFIEGVESGREREQKIYRSKTMHQVFIVRKIFFKFSIFLL